MQPNENDNRTSIYVELTAHNKGAKSTTIHRTELTFEYNKVKKMINSDIAFIMTPSSTQILHSFSNLDKNDLRIYDKIQNCILIIYHTYGKINLNLGTIEEYKR